MARQDLKLRTKKFALGVLALTKRLRRSLEEDVLRRQLVRSATSVGAHYRAADRAKSDADFTYKILGAQEESDESGYWLELAIDSGMLQPVLAGPLLKEAGELTAIFASIVIKMRRRGLSQLRP